MELFQKAAEVLRSNTFDRRRVMAAYELYKRARGSERDRIGELFESQYALADDPDDLEWLQLFLSGPL